MYLNIYPKNYTNFKKKEDKFKGLIKIMFRIILLIIFIFFHEKKNINTKKNRKLCNLFWYINNKRY